jgi:hypothetical protein
MMRLSEFKDDDCDHLTDCGREAFDVLTELASEAMSCVQERDPLNIAPIWFREERRHGGIIIPPVQVHLRENCDTKDLVWTEIDRFGRRARLSLQREKGREPDINMLLTGRSGNAVSLSTYPVDPGVLYLTERPIVMRLAMSMIDREAALEALLEKYGAFPTRMMAAISGL